MLGRFRLRRFSTQHLDDRSQERESLAGAGLGGANHVLAFKGRSNGARLDGCEGNELSCRQLLLQQSRQGQFRKCGHSMVFFLEGLNVNFSNSCSQTRVESSHAALFEIGAGTKRRAGNSGSVSDPTGSPRDEQTVAKALTAV